MSVIRAIRVFSTLLIKGVTQGLPDVGGGEVSDQKWSGG